MIIYSFFEIMTLINHSDCKRDFLEINEYVISHQAAFNNIELAIIKDYINERAQEVLK